MAGLVPAARRLEAGAPQALARAFARLSWPAFAVVVVTGFWNVSTFHLADQTTAWKVVLGVKIAVVALAGLAASPPRAGHHQGRTGRVGVGGRPVLGGRPVHGDPAGRTLKCPASGRGRRAGERGGPGNGRRGLGLTFEGWRP